MKRMIQDAKQCLEALDSASYATDESRKLYIKAVSAYTLAVHCKDYNNLVGCVSALDDMYLYLDEVSDIFNLTY